jgi:uncharacterized membrane protein (DUF4010 family)
MGAMIQSLRAVAVVLLVAAIATAGYVIARWLGSPHEVAMIFSALYYGYGAPRRPHGPKVALPNS